MTSVGQIAEKWAFLHTFGDKTKGWRLLGMHFDSINFKNLYLLPQQPEWEESSWRYRVNVGGGAAK